MGSTRSHATTADILSWTAQCLSAFPVAFLISLGSVVLYGRARLGWWPIAHLNDPKDIGISYVIFGLLTLALLLGALITILFVPQRGFRTRSFRSAISWGALALVLWTVLILVVKWDPGNYIEWIFD
jgi:hypothetical protein